MQITDTFSNDPEALMPVSLSHKKNPPHKLATQLRSEGILHHYQLRAAHAGAQFLDYTSKVQKGTSCPIYFLRFNKSDLVEFQKDRDFDPLQRAW